MTTDASIPIQLNGEDREVGRDASVGEILRELGLDPTNPKGIAVAVNDEVVRKADWVYKRLAAGDRVEVITARQGG